MVAECTGGRAASEVKLRTALALAGGEVVQAANGLAAVHLGAKAAAAGDDVTLITEGIFDFVAATGICLLDGMPAFWDHSANCVTFKKVNDRDFFLGSVVGDKSSASTTVKVNLNVKPVWTLDALNEASLSVPTGTQAVGGFGFPKRLGGSSLLELTATSEAQCIDMLTVDRVAPSANPIVRGIIRVPTNGTGSAVDFSLGLANGTHATDADSIGEYLFLRINGASLALNLISKDGTTTVPEVDTTKVFVAGSAVANRVEVWFDCRDPSDIQCYIEGVNVLPASVFRLDNATGPLALLAHLEKTTGTTTGQFSVDALQALTAQQ